MKLALTKSTVASKKLSYVIYNNIIPVGSWTTTDYFEMDALLNYVAIFLNITAGGVTSLSIKVEQSLDGSNWFIRPTLNSETSYILLTEKPYTISLSGNTAIVLLEPVIGNYMRISLKGAGSETGSNCQLSVCGA